MLKLFVGLILLSAPFLLLIFSKNKRADFVVILFFETLLQSALGIFTQAFGIFYYQVILWANLLAFLFFIFFVLKQIPRINVNFKRIDWALVLVFIISLATLFQVHFNYTGRYNMVNDELFQYHNANNMSYVYPYFSDEWYAVALAKESINSHSLPLKNPFDNSFFFNVEMFFHSFIAEIMLFLGLSPLNSYTTLSIFINTLIIVLAYIFLRESNLSKTTSAVFALCLLYITSASNLPGIWNLIPFTMGIFFSLIGMIFMLKDKLKMALLSLLLVALFYPPLVIFYGLAVAFYLFIKFKLKDKLVFFVKPLMIIISVMLVLFVLVMISPLSGFLNYIFSKIFYKSFTGSFTPQFNPFYIVPWLAIFLLPFGLFYIFKNKKWVFYQFMLGIILWIFYAFSNFRIVIGYERTVIYVSFLAVLISAFSVGRIKDYIQKKFSYDASKIIKFTEIAVIILFLITTPFYTQNDRWQKLILTNYKIQADSIPKSPANNYLTNDDLTIFQNIKSAKFLSAPWKGTVVAISTGNYPVITKGGTITMGYENPIFYQQFLDSDCQVKVNIAKEKNIDYVYSTPFTCQGFNKLNESKEGFTLYEFNI